MCIEDCGLRQEFALALQHFGLEHVHSVVVASYLVEIIIQPTLLKIEFSFIILNGDHLLHHVSNRHKSVFFMLDLPSHATSIIELLLLIIQRGHWLIEGD